MEVKLKTKASQQLEDKAKKEKKKDDPKNAEAIIKAHRRPISND